MINNKQYDSRWGSKPYAAQTYSAAGCGPTAVSDIAGTRADTVGDYITQIGGAVPGWGTDWSAIPKALKHFGFEAKQLNSSSLYGVKNSETEQEWLAAMKSGNYEGILLFGPGVFTSGGHFVAIREVNGNNQINVYDPASAARDGWHKVGDWRGAVKVFYISKKKAPAPGGDYTFKPSTVNYGDYNNSVLLCQELLKAKGYYSLKLDSSAGWGTLGAVESFQKASDLAPDSICGINTWKALLKGVAVKDCTFTLHSVQNGSNNADVLVLQEILKSRTIYKGDLDGSFGNQTEEAVRFVQRSNKLGEDGICGLQTWAALISI